MSIGLYDQDLFNFRNTFFNLELMKISAYYKRRSEIVILTPNLEKNKHSKIYYRKDYNYGDISLNLKGVNYGGYAFTNNIYKPLPEDIENQKPDVTIYEPNKFIYQLNNQYMYYYKTSLGGCHSRLSLDNKKVNKDFLKSVNTPRKIRSIIIHDKDVFGLEDWKDGITELQDYCKREFNIEKFGSKFPLNTDKLEDISFLMDKGISRNIFLTFNGIMNDEQLYELSKKDNFTILSDCLVYNITDLTNDLDDFIKEYLPTIFFQLVFLKSKRIFFLLNYEDSNKDIANIVKILNGYTKYCYRHAEYKNYEKNYLITFIKSLTNKKRRPTKYDFTLADCRIFFQQVKERNYDLFKSFYEVNNVKLTGGKFNAI